MFSSVLNIDSFRWLLDTTSLQVEDRSVFIWSHPIVVDAVDASNPLSISKVKGTFQTDTVFGGLYHNGEQLRGSISGRNS